MYQTSDSIKQVVDSKPDVDRQEVTKCTDVVGEERHHVASQEDKLFQDVVVNRVVPDEVGQAQLVTPCLRARRGHSKRLL